MKTLSIKPSNCPIKEEKKKWTTKGVVTEEEKQMIRDLAKKNLTQTAIARMTGRSTYVVNEVLRKSQEEKSAFFDIDKYSKNTATV